MSRGPKPRQERGTSSRDRAVFAVVLVVVAGVAPWVGVAVATGDAPGERALSTQLPDVLGPAVGPGNGTSNPGNGTSNPGKGGPAATSAPTETSTSETTRDGGGAPTRTATTDVRRPETTDEATGSPTTDEQSTETSSGRPADPGNPPNGAPGAGSGNNESGPPENGTPGNGAPPNAGEGEPPAPGNSPANRTGPPGEINGSVGPPGTNESRNVRNGPPVNRTGPPANRTGPPANRTGPPGNETGGPNGTVPPGLAESNRSQAVAVNATVENATANEPASVNVSTPENRDDSVSFSSVNVTPTRNESFTLNVTTNEDPISKKTPSVDLSNGTEPMAYMSVDHSIDDRNISNVTFTFRVRQDRVNASERENVALYRFKNGTWNDLPTELVRTTENHYVYRVRSPGLSEFAAGKQQPQFDITNASVAVTTMSAGDAMEVRVRIENEGEADGTFTAELLLDGESVADRQLTIASGGMRQTTFVRRVAEPGRYDVFVNDYRIDEVSVNGTARTDEESSNRTSASGRTDRESTDRDPSKADPNDSASYDSASSVPGFGVGFGVAGIALFVGLAARRRR